ncbi:MAG TPA: hypothetical protein PL009_11890 [Flavipsychrobacter sp.]|nr:hypothetical protein [Flavipsychrobacter sp.]
MEDRRKHIDDLFREGLGDFRETPPASVWTALEQRLPAQEEPNRKWLWYLMLLLLLGTAAYFVYKATTENATENRKTNQNTNSIPNAKPNTIPQPEAGNTVASKEKSSEKNVEKRNNDVKNSAGTYNAKQPSSPQDERRQNIANRNAVSPVQSANNRSLTAKQQKANNPGKHQVKTQSGKKENAGSVAQHLSDKFEKSQTKNKNLPASVNKNNDGDAASVLTHSDKKVFDKRSGNKNALSSANGVPATTSKNNTTQDNSFLLQPIPEEDEEDNENSLDEKETTTTKKRATTSEEEKEKPLLYIPPEAFPNTEKSVAANTTIGKSYPETQKNFSNNHSQGAAEKFKGKNIEVSAATGNKKEIEVVGETFRNKKNTPVKNEKITKSNLIVASEIANDPQEKIAVMGVSTDNVSTENSLKTSNKFSLAAAGNGTFKEEKNNAQSSLSGGGGGGGGGAASPQKNGSKFRFDLGIKAGYERGFADFTTNTFIISPYLQWNISTGFAFVLQPGFRYNQLNRNDIFGGSQSYHKITNAQVTESHIYGTDSINGVMTPTVQRNYSFTNTYDSVRVGAMLQTRTFWEIELPIMLRYKIASNFAVFGGLSMIFGNLVEMEEKRETYSGLTRSSNLSFDKVDTAAPAPVLPAPDQFFNYNTQNIGAASNNNLNPATNPVRLGLMFGFSYELQKRITLDVLYKQTISDMKYVPNEQVRKIYTQPYLRVMLGFKLFEGGKQDNIVKNPADL